MGGGVVAEAVEERVDGDDEHHGAPGGQRPEAGTHLTSGGWHRRIRIAAGHQYGEGPVVT